MAAVGRADVMTAVADSAENLKAISWQVEPGYFFQVGERGQIRRSGTRTAGSISAVDLGASESDLLLAVRDAGGHIKLINYRTNYWELE